jgi:hypothetical protein
MTHSHTVVEPCGSHIDKPSRISWLKSKTSLFLWLCLMNQACSRFFRRETLKWSRLEEVFRVTCAFSKKKVHSLSVAPEPLAIWNKKLEGLEFWLLKKLQISFEDMYPAAPKHLFRFFFIVKNSDRGSLIFFLGSQFYVRGWWWLAVELNSL